MKPGEEPNGDKAPETLSIPLSQWIKTAPPTREWLLKKFLPAKAVVLISGQQKRAMKTFLALVMAVVIATKKKSPPFIPGALAGPVLFVEEEGEDGETRDRIEAICAGLKVKVPSNIHWMFHSRVKLDDKMWRVKLLREIKRTKACCTFLDAWSYLKKGDENSSTEMQPALDTVFAGRALGCSMVILCHLDKAKGEDKKMDIDNQIRGSSLLSNAYDQHLALRRYNIRDAVIDLHIRSRGGAQKDFAVTWNLEAIEQLDSDGDPFDKLVRAVPKIIAVSGSDVNVYRDRLERGRVYSSGELTDIWGIPLAASKSVRDVLFSNGEIEKEGKSWTLVAQQN